MREGFVRRLSRQGGFVWRLRDVLDIFSGFSLLKALIVTVDPIWMQGQVRLSCCSKESKVHRSGDLGSVPSCAAL